MTNYNVTYELHTCLTVQQTVNVALSSDSVGWKSEK